MAVLHRCKNNDDGKIKLKHFRVLTAVNGVPVELKGCSSPMCKLDDFLEKYEQHSAVCDLMQFCKWPIPNQDEDDENDEDEKDDDRK